MNQQTLDKIKTDLIGTGIFLERDTYELLHNWDSGTELFTIKREFPYNYGVHPTIINGTLDILGASAIDDGEMVLILPIECKKADPKLKHWVFEPHRPSTLREMPFFLYGQEGGYKFNQTYYSFPTLGYVKYPDYECCVNAFEFNDVTGNVNRQSDKNLRAFYAIRQANEAVPGIVEQLEAIMPKPRLNVPNIIIPIIVTTANLWVTQYDPADIDKATGNIDPNKVSLEAKKWLLYSYPLAFHETVSGVLETKTSKTTVRPEKRPTFIVTASALPDFIAHLIGDVQSYFRPYQA